MQAISKRERDEISLGKNGAVGDNLFDMLDSYAKKHYPTVTIEDEEDTPNHAKELRIDDDKTSTAWMKNTGPLKVVK